MTPSPTLTATATAAPATSPSTSLCLGFGSSSTDGRPAEPKQPPAERRWGTCCELSVGYYSFPWASQARSCSTGANSLPPQAGAAHPPLDLGTGALPLCCGGLIWIFPSFIGCLILGSMKETRRMVFHGGRWCDLHGSAAMAWEPE